MNASSSALNLTYSSTDDGNLTTVQEIQWETVYVGTTQVRNLVYSDRMNVLGELSKQQQQQNKPTTHTCMQVYHIQV